MLTDADEEESSQHKHSVSAIENVVVSTEMSEQSTAQLTDSNQTMDPQ